MSPDPFQTFVASLLWPADGSSRRPLVDRSAWLGEGADPTTALTTAFLIGLAGPAEPDAASARALLDDPSADSDHELAELFREGLRAVPGEIAGRLAGDPSFAAVLEAAAARLADPSTDEATATEAGWSVLFPEAVGLLADVETGIESLRAERIVRVTALASPRIEDPVRELLLTSNVLLTLPLDAGQDSAPGLAPDVVTSIEAARGEPQRYWFDHPIPIGVRPEHNELLHGLRGLDQAVAVELERRGSRNESIPEPRLACLLSVSVTHPALRNAARPYLEGELERAGGTRHLDVSVVTEGDARRLVDEVLAPAAERFLGGARTFEVFGVDGEYGRHYSFLKAIAAVWQVFVDPTVRATFKIDLDQVFPQDVLLEETGATAFEHLRTPLWGARGLDAAGREVELGMVAGALVNQRDIGQGLFTPDVPLPGPPQAPEERAFYSVLPQALSTRSEMMERYDSAMPDGSSTVLERVHVTGGTNGILVDALRGHRPFTPSFVGRAEDQAYILSVLGQSGPRLAYVHAAGLIMRHDKEAYAGEAIEAAHVGKLVGDYVRILIFSAYADAVARTGEPDGLDLDTIKALLGPFTGSFISRLPITVTLLRFALKIAGLTAAGEHRQADEFARIGARRLRETLRMTMDRDGFRARIVDEQEQWRGFYDTLDAVEDALQARDPGAAQLQERAREILEGCRIRASAEG